MSTSNPLTVTFLPLEPHATLGQLGLTIAPGKKGKSSISSKVHNRDLFEDLERLRYHYKVDALFSLMESGEMEKYEIAHLHAAAHSLGIDVVPYPVADINTPKDQTTFETAIRSIVLRLFKGETVVIHCRGGLGRSGLAAASVLVALGHSPQNAVREVRRARPGAIETKEQHQFIFDFAQTYQSAPTPKKSDGPATTLVDRYLGCLLGLAVGDALGTTVEFKAPGSFPPVEDMVGGGPFRLEPGQWTDDTSLALCLAESLITTREYNPVDQLERYLRWWHQGHLSSTGSCFDIGNTTRAALHRFEDRRHPHAGSTASNTAGNGSLMRLAPVPLAYAWYPEGATVLAGESSRTTHGAQTAVDACRYYAGLIVGALQGHSKKVLLSPRFRPGDDGRPARWLVPEEGLSKERPAPLHAEVDAVALGSFKNLQPPRIQGSGYVVRSLEAALWAFYNSNSFEEGALLAVNLGDDADTTAAIYGQLAGAYYGVRQLPDAWLEPLAKRDLIEQMARDLLALRFELEECCRAKAAETADICSKKMDIRPMRRAMQSVRELHRLGYERLRLVAWKYGWRHALAPAHRTQQNNGLLVDGELDLDLFGHQTVTSFCWEPEEVQGFDPFMLALLVLSRWSNVCKGGAGQDQAYMDWYKWMLEHTGDRTAVYGAAEYADPPQGYVFAKDYSEEGQGNYYLPAPPPFDLEA